MDTYRSPRKRPSYRRRKAQRRKQMLMQSLPFFLLCVIMIALIGGGIFLFKKQKDRSPEMIPDASTTPLPKESASQKPSEEDTNAESSAEESDTLLEEAQRIAAGYDYDRAIEMLKAAPQYETDQRFSQAAADYEAIKATLVPADPTQITHIFFHSLVIDEAKAFDGDADENGYNQVMTTKDEFIKILDSMREKGFVLVRLHDIASMTTDENGTHMKRNTILLPEGKKPFVMSQDDVCYYDYMSGDGFASRMVIGDDGKPTCEMKLDDGTVSRGAYDLVPILEEYIQQYPEFSYKGARAILAFTGYQGILGYRTDASYSDSPTYEEDRRTAAAVAQCLKDNGWELASHSWGHRDLGNISYENFQTDCNKWEQNVESLIGPTDIILFPFGADIGDWHPYTHENERFNYLKSLGFDYFCNVDSSPYWIQIGDDFLRQGRRNLDGFRMWKDIEAGSDTSRRKLDDLFRAEDVFSANRKTPVTWK